MPLLFIYLDGWTAAQKTRLTRMAANRVFIHCLGELLIKVGTGDLSFSLGQPTVMRRQSQQYFADSLFDGDLVGFP